MPESGILFIFVHAASRKTHRHPASPWLLSLLCNMVQEVPTQAGSS
jgi:hypothetical protein